MPVSSVPLSTHSLFTAADPDIKAYIAVDGEPLEVVYKTESGESGRNVRGFILAEPGRNFALGLYDGRLRACGWYIQPPKRQGLPVTDGSRFFERAKIEIGQNTTRRLCFASVDTTADDDEVSASTYTELDGITALEFKFFWVKEAKIVSGGAVVEDLLLKQQKAQPLIPEDFGKIKLPMQPSFGPIERQANTAVSKQVWETTLEDPHNPFATMKFLLRSEPVFDRLKLQDQNRQEALAESRLSTPPLVIDRTIYLDMSPNEALADARADEKRVKAEEPENSPLRRHSKRARQHESTPERNGKLGRYSPDALQTPPRPAPNALLERAVADAIAKVLPGVLADMLGPQGAARKK